MLVVDTGPLVATAASDDRDHERCATFLAHARKPLVVPALVIAEVAYLLARRIGQAAEEGFARSFREGELIAEPIEPPDWARIVELLGKYADVRLGTVDASVVAACERLGVVTLATLDHRHFTVVRPAHADGFELVP
jgi:predicted nucleic acid-binding protein